MKQYILLLLIVVLFSASLHAADENGAIVIPVNAAASTTGIDDLYNLNHPAWAQADKTALHFHRTPPLYNDGPYDDGERPVASVRFIRFSDKTLVLRLEWSDSTLDNFEQGVRYPDAGEPHVYKTHTSSTNQFGDSACLMAPKTRAPMSAYPSMMMGDAASPVDLFFWQAGRGFSLLQAHGRASTAAAQTEQALTGKSFRQENGWAVIFVLPDLSASIPVCFAIWDGAKQQRDGLKYYSLWYEIQS